MEESGIEASGRGHWGAAERKYCFVAAEDAKRPRRAEMRGSSSAVVPDSLSDSRHKLGVSHIGWKK